MSIIWILFFCSIVVLPAIALLALRWAMRQGEFKNLEKTALSIFDDEEPVGRVTDHFPGSGVTPSRAAPRSATQPPRAY